MPKVTLIFNLPEEKEEHYDAWHGSKYREALSAIDTYCRGKLKYEDLSEEVSAVCQEIRDKIREELDGVEL